MLIPVLYIHACALSAHTCARVFISATHLWLAVTPLSLPGAGNVYSDILGFIVVHDNMTDEWKYRIRDFTRGAYQDLLIIPSNGTSYSAHMLSINYHNYYIQNIKITNKTGTSSLLSQTHRNSQLSTNWLIFTRFAAANNWAWRLSGQITVTTE